VNSLSFNSTLKHSLASRLALMLITLSTVLLNTHYLGKEGLGSVALLQFGLLLVTGLAGFVAAGAVVYVRRSSSPKDIRWIAYLWCVFSAIIASFLGVKLGAIPKEWLFESFYLGLLQSIVIFHSQLLIASGKIKEHNILFLVQAVVILINVAVAYLVLDKANPEGFAYALTVSFLVTTFATFALLKGTWDDKPTVKAEEGAISKLFKNGAQGQTGSVLQLLTNRSNLSLLESFIGSAGAGVYSVVYYGAEAVWTVARAFAPMVNNEVAKAKSTMDGMLITIGYLKRTLILTIPLVLIACMIPESIYFFIFGIDGIAIPIRLLAPGMIAGAISSIIAHHLSGVGLHKWNAITSGLALIVLLCVGNYLIPTMEVCGAAIAASCAYSAQALGLILIWTILSREEN
tara:strand:- start:333 stop:1541 length:1209 start_codon:yes stop_codon:yes gene_type:complete